MKIFTLISTAMVSCIWIGQAHAQIVPESTADIRTCQAWAETHKGTINYEPANARCLALQNCRDNRSSNENTWRECVYRVEMEFHRQMSGEHVLPVEAPFKPDSRVVTENPDSVYENRTGKGFSFDDAAQGD